MDCHVFGPKNEPRRVLLRPTCSCIGSLHGFVVSRGNKRPRCAQGTAKSAALKQAGIEGKAPSRAPPHPGVAHKSHLARPIEHNRLPKYMVPPKRVVGCGPSSMNGGEESRLPARAKAEWIRPKFYACLSVTLGTFFFKEGIDLVDKRRRGE